MSRTVFIEQDLTAYMGFGVRQQFPYLQQDQKLFHSSVHMPENQHGTSVPTRDRQLKEVADVPSVGFYCIHITVDGFGQSVTCGFTPRLDFGLLELSTCFIRLISFVVPAMTVLFLLAYQHKGN